MPGRAAKASDPPAQALEVLKTHCFKCHAAGAKKGGVGYLDDLAEIVKKKKVVANNLAQSRIYLRITDGEMPPPGDEPAKRRPSDAEIKAIEAWIQQGAKPLGTPVTPVATRPRFTLAAELTAMRDHLRNVDEADRPFQRFFTLRNINNTPTRTDEELDFHRAALGKAINSLSWRKRMVVPKKLDGVGLVYAVDLRKDLDWEADRWQLLLSAYPYGLTHEQLPDDRAVNDLAREIYALCGTNAPSVRIDWFISRATRPPLYHDLLGVPATDKALEDRLGVQALKNIQEGNVRRAGMVQSGISGQHRLIERHEATNGYYWKSYDFKPTAKKGDLTRFPLGPVFPGNRYDDFAFTHDGGELIFALPNGLQGYMLVDAKGGRIDAGPPDVVSDDSQISGDSQIINGVSCIACHHQGMVVDYEDVVRSSTSLRGAALEFLRRIYPTKDEIQRETEQDRENFRAAVLNAMRGMAEHDERLQSSDGNVLEPIGSLAKFYAIQPLGIEELAGELDMDPQALKLKLENDDRFREIGLGPLATGSSRIKRATWENLDARLSPFQRAANFLNLGTPKVVLRR